MEIIPKSPLRHIGEQLKRWITTAILWLGCYDNATITVLGDICSDRRNDGFFDVKLTLTYVEVLKTVEDTGLLGADHVSCCVYHFPFTCKDKCFQSFLRAVGPSVETQP